MNKIQNNVEEEKFKISHEDDEDDFGLEQENEKENALEYEKELEIFDSIILSAEPEKIFNNMNLLEKKYHEIIEETRKTSNEKIDAVEIYESQKVKEEFDRLQAEVNRNLAQLKEEVSKSIQQHNQLMDEHMKEIDKIYRNSKDELIDKVIEHISQFLGVKFDEIKYPGGNL